ncbi:MAG TPA: UvrD-helicase domain-containing protein, partial [Bacteroidia bacterium]|nr:UvrD-helicase domain-containing protein [Bacteroidia bacterium]
MNELKIYRSSAGSGKTYMLVFEYLRIVLERPAEFRHILAVTFTNKAADEMKSRIISALSELSAGGNENLEKHLKEFVNPKIN